MDFKLKGKSVLVTGSTKGIGFTTTSLLALEGKAPRFLLMVVLNNRLTLR